MGGPIATSGYRLPGPLRLPQPDSDRFGPRGCFPALSPFFPNGRRCTETNLKTHEFSFYFPRLDDLGVVVKSWAIIPKCLTSTFNATFR